MPPIAEAGDLGLYVRKFCGAGQGVRALVAEPRASGMARAVDLPVPDTVLAHLDPSPAQPSLVRQSKTGPVPAAI